MAFRIVLGLSGGIDSALAACVASAAVGAQNVKEFLCLQAFKPAQSIDDAKATAEALGLNFIIQPITDLHAASDTALEDILEGGHPVAGEKLQARLRGLIVMAHANAHGQWRLLQEINQNWVKVIVHCTEIWGGYAPLGDLYKMEVYALAKQFNERMRIEAVTEST